MDLSELKKLQYLKKNCKVAVIMVVENSSIKQDKCNYKTFRVT